MSTTEQVVIRFAVSVDRFAAAMRLAAAAALRATPAMHRYRSAVLRARKQYRILERQERRLRVYRAQRPQLIHKGGKP